MKQQQVQQTLWQIGQEVSGKGIYFGTWSPKDPDGVSLGKTFNLFAAPCDLTNGKLMNAVWNVLRPGAYLNTRMDYDTAIDRVAALRWWNGYDGMRHVNDATFCAALRDDRYTGQWFIPPRELLVGLDANGIFVQDDNLLAHRDKGALRESFTQACTGDAEFPLRYWTSTEVAGMRGHAAAARVTDGGTGSFLPKSSPLNCRLVRAELVA